MEAECDSELAADVPNPKLQASYAVESSGAEDEDHEADERPSIQFAKTRYFKRLIQVSIVVSAISVAMNSRKTFEVTPSLW